MCINMKTIIPDTSAVIIGAVSKIIEKKENHLDCTEENLLIDELVMLSYGLNQNEKDSILNFSLLNK